MKRCSLLCISLLIFANPLSWSMEYDQYEDEYDQAEDESNTNDTMMMQQAPDMMSSNGMMMNQGMLQNSMPMQNTMQQDTMMMQQMPGMMSSNGMMMNQMHSPEIRGQEDETSKKEYVQSLVNNILQVNNRQQKKASQSTKGGSVIDRNLKNKIFKLQKDLDEISRSLSGISQSGELTIEEESSKRSKSSKEIKTSGKKKSSDKSTVSKKGESSGKLKSRKSSVYNRKRRRGRNRKIFRSNYAKNFYTVKQLTPKNAVRYVPKYYSSVYDKAKNFQQPTISYKIKNWGTGEVISSESYYSPNSYFSNKAKCDKGCGAQ